MSNEDVFAAPSAATIAAERVIVDSHDAARRLLARALGVCLRWGDPIIGEQAEALHLVRQLDLEAWPVGALRNIAARVVIGDTAEQIAERATFHAPTEAPRPGAAYEVRRELALMRRLTSTLADASSPTLADAVASLRERETIMVGAIEACRAARCADRGTVARLVVLVRQVRAVIYGEPEVHHADAA